MTDFQINSISGVNRSCPQLRMRFSNDAGIIDKALGVTILVIGIVMLIGGIVILSISIPSAFNMVAGAVVLGNGLSLGILSVYLLYKVLKFFPKFLNKDAYFYFKTWQQEMVKIEEKRNEKEDLNRIVKAIRQTIKNEYNKAKGIVITEDEVDHFPRMLRTVGTIAGQVYARRMVYRASARGMVMLIKPTWAEIKKMTTHMYKTHIYSRLPTWKQLAEVRNHLIEELGDYVMDILGIVDYMDLCFILAQVGSLIGCPALEGQLDKLQQAVDKLKDELENLTAQCRDFVQQKLISPDLTVSEEEVTKLSLLKPILSVMDRLENIMCDAAVDCEEGAEYLFIFTEDQFGWVEDPKRCRDIKSDLETCKNLAIEAFKRTTLPYTQKVNILKRWRIMHREIGDPESESCKYAIKAFKMLLMCLQLA